MSFRGASLQTRQKYDESPTFKIDTTSACILCGRNIFRTPRAERTTVGLMPLGLVFFFFGGHLPQTCGFRSAKEILVVSFATRPRAFILSDRNIFYTPPWGGEQRRGLMPLGLFLSPRHQDGV